METISLKIEPKFLSAIKRIMKRHNYMTQTEFIRESLRDKIKILEEKEILENKGVMSQLKESEKNINKKKIRKFEY